MKKLIHGFWGRNRPTLTYILDSWMMMMMTMMMTMESVWPVKPVLVKLTSDFWGPSALNIFFLKALRMQFYYEKWTPQICYVKSKSL
jgi:hypothetical protein